MPDDLNQRVQARLVELEHEARAADEFLDGHHHPYDPDRLWDPAYALQVLIPSWRERWDRHQPVPLGTAQAATTPRVCGYCNVDTEGGDYYCNHQNVAWPCPDALAVLREIGIEL